MAKNTNRVATAIAYVAALGLATGALADRWEMTVNNPVTYATEIFGGDGTDLELQTDDEETTGAEEDEQTSVDLTLFLPNDASVSVAADSELEVTLTLNGATFGEAVNWTDIEVGGDLSKVTGSQHDGRRGDQSITLRVKADAEISVTSSIEGENKFAVATRHAVRFDIGSIRGYGGTGTVTASATMRVTGGPQDNFPTEVQSAPRDAVAAINVGDTIPAPTEADPNATRTATAEDVVAAVSATANMIANAMAAMSYDAAGNDAGGEIDLDDRTALAGMDKLEVASFSHGPNSMAPDAKTSDGMTSFATEEGSQANLTVTVTGMVRANDMIWLDQDGDGMMTGREGMTVTGGSASKTYRITNVPSGSSVYFQPNDTDDMSEGSITATFAVEYDDDDWVTPETDSGTVGLRYADIMMQARAYAIPQPDLMDTGMTDVGNVRIKCHAEGDSTCTVFLDCDEQDGTRHFEEIGETIAAGATAVLQSGDIADLLPDLDGGTWNGRLSCDVYSEESLSVQVLVRNRTGHPLINNTYIEGGED